MIQVNRIYLIFNRLVTKKFLVDTSDGGNIVEQGTHEQLLKDEGLYAHLWDIQEKSCNWKVNV